MEQMSLRFLLLLSLFYGVQCRMVMKGPPLSSYRVGVFEHAVLTPSHVIDSREKALQAMRLNIDVYNETVVSAKLKGVKLIVFPEYGIYDTSMTRKRMNLFAETISGPKDAHRNPCNDPDFQNQSTEVQRRLSCIARDNAMFLVANMAGRVTCSGETGCPSDGQYLYNTNVVFSPRGEIVARYYKTHLFGEHEWFNSAKTIETAIFDTPFGKFGTFICFDIMFKQPALDLIEKHNIRNIVYPTAWIDVPPIFASILMHSSFAQMAKVNLLSANAHYPQASTYGSGIFTPKGAAVYYHKPNTPTSKLLVVDIHQTKDAKPETVEPHSKYPHEKPTGNGTVLDLFNPSDISMFKFQHLKAKSGSVRVCDKEFCCQASYAIKGRFQEVYALGVFKGYLLVSGNKLYTEICTLLNCPSGKCGTHISDVRTVFSHISLQRTGFGSNYVFPTVAAMDKGQLYLVKDTWTYSGMTGIRTRPGKTITLHSANMIGRVYSKDILLRDAPKEQNYKSENTFTAPVRYILFAIASYVFSFL